MARRPEGLARFADKLVLGICLALSIAALVRREDDRVAIGTAWAHRLSTPIESVIDRIDSLRRLRSENEELRTQLAALRMDIQQVLAERARIEELERRAGFFEQTRGLLVPARVIELVVSRLPIQAKIQVAGYDSLRVLQPVVSESGLVGRIRQVLAPDLALVELLTDVDSRISVEDIKTGVVGILRHDGRRFLMDHVPRGEPVEVGDLLHSSGLGGTVPRGIAVGTVAEVSSSPSELFQQIRVEPLVRFSALNEVYVVVRSGPWYTREGFGRIEAPAAADSASEGEARR
jgi:rod shape-determining protein MreC